MWLLSNLGRREFQRHCVRWKLKENSFPLSSPMSTGGLGDGVEGANVKIFDRSLKRKQRDRAAWLMRSKDTFVETVAENLLDRLEDCKRNFPTALCLGGSMEPVRRLLHGRGGIEKFIMMDMSYDMIKKCRDLEQSVSEAKFETLYVVGDEEFLPIKESSLDLVVSCLGLHWVNDLPGAMVQCRRALKPDGLFLVAILGGETLRELRIACTVAQMEREGGISPRISPLAQVRDAGNLLTRAGLALPAVDVDEFTVKYDNGLNLSFLDENHFDKDVCPTWHTRHEELVSAHTMLSLTCISALELIEHLRLMGETNALLQRNQILKKETALATAAIYQSMFGGEDGTIPATFQVIYMTGWGPDPLQQRPKRRGSATASFEDIQKVFATQETPAP